jgi:hypothetical protein
MNTFTIILAVVAELVALIVIARLWIQRRMSLLPRILVSVLFLVPFIFLVWFAYFEIIGGETILERKKPQKTDAGVH